MTDVRKGREGSRWYNHRPSGEEFAEWFKTVPIHDGLNYEDFISGITLIQQVEKTLDVVGFDATTNAPQIQEVKHLVYIPYAKVDTRVAYFWKYMESHPDWLGLIEPVTYAGQSANNFNLPPGYFPHVQTHGEKRTAYVGCSMQVRVYERDTARWVTITETGPDGRAWHRRGIEGKLIFQGAPGTKIVATATKFEVDPFSIMRSETGAVGRALGMAGMLVIPGSGVATAEDMQEAAAGASPLPADTPALPGGLPAGTADQETDPAFLRSRIAALLTELGADFPDVLTQFQEWARERGFTSVDTLSDAQIKGVTKKLEKTLDDARRAQAPALAPTD